MIKGLAIAARVLRRPDLAERATPPWISGGNSVARR